MLHNFGINRVDKFEIKSQNELQFGTWSTPYLYRRINVRHASIENIQVDCEFVTCYYICL